MKKFLVILVALAMVIPSTVKAETSSTTILSGGIPVLDGNVFEARGTAVEINEVSGKTIVTWEGNTTGIELPADAIVVGGYANVCSADEKCSINLESTSITMNSGTVANIIAGNNVNTNYDSYEKISVNNAMIDINGGNIIEVYGVTGQYTSIPIKYYGADSDYYSINNLTMNVNDVAFANRIALTVSYTNLKKAEVNLTNVNIQHPLGFMAATNGFVDDLTLNVDGGSISYISAGQRAMVNNFDVNVYGDAEVDYVYLGSYYPLSEHSNEVWWDDNIGYVNYGLVNSMNVTFSEDATYGNIYPGFQFVELEEFADKYKDNANFELLTQGFANADKANVNVTVNSAPTVFDEGLTGVFDMNLDNIKTTYVPEPVLPTIPTTPVTKPTVVVEDSSSVIDTVMDSISDNEVIKDLIAGGADIEVGVNVTEISDETVIAKATEDMKDVLASGKIATFFDISVLVYADNETLKISELSNEIEFTILVPEELMNVENGIEREFFIIREHDGEITRIPATLTNDGKITFKSALFSTYALAYEDSAIVVTPDVVNPDTGDNIMIYVMLAIFAMGGLYFTRKKLVKE